MENKSAGVQGITAMQLLGIVFVTLKLTNYITWSWWWVTAPFWGGLALMLVILLIMLIGPALVAILAAPINAVLTGGEWVWMKLRGK